MVLKAGTAGLKHLSFFLTGTAGLAKLKLPPREKKRDHVPHVACGAQPHYPHVIRTLALSPRPVLPAQDRVSRRPGKAQPHSERTVYSRTSRASQQHTLTGPFHSGVTPFDTWVIGSAVVFVSRLNQREGVGNVEHAIQLIAAARPRGAPWSLLLTLKRR